MIAWTPPALATRQPYEKMIGRVKAGKELVSGRATSVEELAVTAQLHPRVIRQGLRLAFPAPEITSTILEGKQPATIYLVKIPKLQSLNWSEQAKSLS